jgi:hypothetical protein
MAAVAVAYVILGTFAYWLTLGWLAYRGVRWVEKLLPRIPKRPPPRPTKRIEPEGRRLWM